MTLPHEVSVKFL